MKDVSGEDYGQESIWERKVYYLLNSLQTQKCSKTIKVYKKKQRENEVLVHVTTGWILEAWC